jgi:alanyl-tRNA synthetase
VERAKDTLLSKAQEINGIKVIRTILPMEAQGAKDLVFKIRQAVPERLLCVVGTTGGGKPTLNVMLSDDMVKDLGLNAGQLVREAAKLIQGGGGGQPHFATAGGKNPDGLSPAIDQVIKLAGL